MKICYLSIEYPPETAWGGIGTYTYNMSHSLAELGHEVHVFSLALKSQSHYLDKRVFVHRVKKTYLPIPFINDPSSCFLYSLKMLLKLKDPDLKFDIIEAPEWRAEGLINSYLSKIPIITRLHTPLFLVNHLSGKNLTPADKIVDLMERSQTKKSTGVTSPTKALKDTVSKRWKIDSSLIAVIPNGINLCKIRSIQTPKSPILSDYIVYIGRLETRKGVHILAKALPHVFKKFSKLKVVFIGENMKFLGATMKDHILSLNRRHEKNLVFTGFVPDEIKYSLIKESQLVILPSLWENFPYTCLESMVLGKTVIASRAGGFEEIIEDGLSGFLVEPGNPEALSNKIIECLESGRLIRQVEKKSAKTAEKYDIAQVSKGYVEYYEKILENQK